MRRPTKDFTDKGLLKKISENATNAANALGEKIKENFLNPAEPPTPEPATPEPPREELVWAQDDLQLFHTYLKKANKSFITKTRVTFIWISFTWIRGNPASLVA